MFLLTLPLSFFHKLVMTGSGNCMEKTEFTSSGESGQCSRGGPSLKDDVVGTFLIAVTRTPAKATY